ncbi:hypothetical protein EG329_003349 [Mollisiaceae sp. DMI_Dod_QoI]|nr:hypothetical protein EG329_003349 [Helotiales sp. DMI_Dod_QoI]
MTSNAIFPSLSGGDDKKSFTVDTNDMPSPPSANPPTAVYSGHKPAVTHLSEGDLKAVREALGAPPIYFESVNPRNPTPASKLSKRVPNGLYKTALKIQKRASLRHTSVTLLYNFCIILQLLLGAILTALSALSLTATKYGTATTIIAAANTINAGVIALLHNSGFPGRLRNDLNEYSKLVEWLEFVMHSGVVDAGMTRDDVIQTAMDKYNEARATVEKNQPSYYVGPKTTTGAATTPAASGDVSSGLQG